MFDNELNTLNKMYDYNNLGEIKQEKELLLKLCSIIWLSNIPLFTKSRLNRVLRFLVNGNLDTNDPDYLETKIMSYTPLIDFNKVEGLNNSSKLTNNLSNTPNFLNRNPAGLST